MKKYLIKTNKGTTTHDHYKGMMPMTTYARLLLADELNGVERVSYRRIE